MQVIFSFFQLSHKVTVKLYAIPFTILSISPLTNENTELQVCQGPN